MFTLKSLHETLGDYMERHPELADKEVQLQIRTGKTHRSTKTTGVRSVGTGTDASGNWTPLALYADLNERSTR